MKKVRQAIPPLISLPFFSPSGIFTLGLALSKRLFFSFKKVRIYTLELPNTSHSFSAGHFSYGVASEKFLQVRKIGFNQSLVGRLPVYAHKSHKNLGQKTQMPQRYQEHKMEKNYLDLQIHPMSQMKLFRRQKKENVRRNYCKLKL